MLLWEKHSSNIEATPCKNRCTDSCQQMDKYSQASSLSFSSISFLPFLFGTSHEQSPTWMFEKADSIVRLEPVSPWVDLVEWNWKWQKSGSMPAHISLPDRVLFHPVQSHFCLAEPHMSSALPGLGYEKADRISCSEFLLPCFRQDEYFPPSSGHNLSGKKKRHGFGFCNRRSWLSIWCDEPCKYMRFLPFWMRSFSIHEYPWALWDSWMNQAESSTKPQVFQVSPAPVALPWPSSRPPPSLRLLGLPDTVVTTSDKLGRRKCNLSAPLCQIHWGATC